MASAEGPQADGSVQQAMVQAAQQLPVMQTHDVTHTAQHPAAVAAQPGAQQHVQPMVDVQAQQIHAQPAQAHHAPPHSHALTMHQHEQQQQQPQTVQHHLTQDQIAQLQQQHQQHEQHQHQQHHNQRISHHMTSEQIAQVQQQAAMQQQVQQHQQQVHQQQQVQQQQVQQQQQAQQQHQQQQQAQQQHQQQQQQQQQVQQQQAQQVQQQQAQQQQQHQLQAQQHQQQTALQHPAKVPAHANVQQPNEVPPLTQMMTIEGPTGPGVVPKAETDSSLTAVWNYSASACARSKVGVEEGNELRRIRNKYFRTRGKHCKDGDGNPISFAHMKIKFWMMAPALLQAVEAGTPKEGEEEQRLQRALDAQEQFVEKTPDFTEQMKLKKPLVDRQEVIDCVIANCPRKLTDEKKAIMQQQLQQLPTDQLLFRLLDKASALTLQRLFILLQVSMRTRDEVAAVAIPDKKGKLVPVFPNGPPSEADLMVFRQTWNTIRDPGNRQGSSMAEAAKLINNNFKGLGCNAMFACDKARPKNGRVVNKQALFLTLTTLFDEEPNLHHVQKLDNLTKIMQDQRLVPHDEDVIMPLVPPDHVDLNVTSDMVMRFHTRRRKLKRALASKTDKERAKELYAAL